ncbi:hypothetical protein SESBI_32987 [Sesbania bispinosa]|nr:hypothetical protein SESBI_32987 [Sesbania bispinosa]
MSSFIFGLVQEEKETVSQGVFDLHYRLKYNQILSDIYQLGQSFSEVGLDARDQEYGNILVDAHGGLMGASSSHFCARN